MISTDEIANTIFNCKLSKEETIQYLDEVLVEMIRKSLNNSNVRYLKMDYRCDRETLVNHLMGIK